MKWRHAFSILALLAIGPNVQAGLYYSGETIAELPSQWRGFLLDQRALRNIAAPTNSPLRKEYVEAAAKLEKEAKSKKLTADELADLGALYVRLGDPVKAVELLRSAQREYPNHFRIVANLGTAWQLRGDLEQAVISLRQAVHLAPGKYQKAEELQLRLVRLREKEPKGTVELDDLFGVKFVNDKNEYAPGQIGAAEAKKLPGTAAALAQQLALWLPADGRLLWQLAELANAQGDVKMAAAIMDGCVTEFGMSNAQLRQHRQLSRTVADALDEQGDNIKTAHQSHAGAMKPRSRRPLLGRLDLAELPPISDKGVNAMPWAVLAETAVAKDFKPTFPKYLKELDGKQIALAGFMQPLREEAECRSFMFIEYPVGCWYCEVPEITAIVMVELPADKTTTVTRGLVKVTGTLKLNASDPEQFLYTITKAKVAEAD